MKSRNELSGTQQLVMVFLTLIVLGLVGGGAQAAWDAVALHKKGQTQQNVVGSVNFSQAVRAASFCALGADACTTNLKASEPPTCTAGQLVTSDGGGFICVDDYAIDDTLPPVNGSLLQWNADASGFAPSQSNIVITTGQVTDDAGVAMMIENKADLSSTQSAFQLRESVTGDAGTTALFNVTGTGQVELVSGQKLCFNPACTAWLYNDVNTVRGNTFYVSGAFTAGPSALQFNKEITNSLTDYGGSVAFNDPIRNLSTTTALFESSTAATAGLDLGFTLNSLVSLGTTDYVLSVQNNGVPVMWVDGYGDIVSKADMNSNGGFYAALGNFGSQTSNRTVTLVGNASDGASAVSTVLNSNVALTTAGAKITSFRNNTVEKAYIDLNGHAYFAGGVDPADIRALNDAGYVWDDVKVPLAGLSKPSIGLSVPDYVAFMTATGTGGTGGTAVYAFRDNQEDDLTFVAQLPHGYANGMPIEPHIHWSMLSGSTGTPGVTWGLECALADDDGSFRRGPTSTVSRSHSTTTATLTLAAGHPYEIGQNIVISAVSEGGCSAGAYNGNYRITAITDTTITYTSGAVSCNEATTPDIGGTLYGYTITREVALNVISDSQWKNIRSSFGTYLMKACTNVSCVLSCRVYRPNLADMAESIPALEIDFHVPLNQIGSRQVTTK